jgi:AraC-like DNA-binding protein
MLLAIDGNQRIMGANRFARTSLMLDDRGLRAGTSLWSIFERNVDIFRRRDPIDFAVRLLIAGSNDSRPALVTPPDRPVAASNNPTSHDLHTRPRLGSIDVSTLPPAPQAWGGLPPGAMRRVREYVEVHLGESIDLSMLAGVAGLSVHHFARQFKQSSGVTPHVYLTQKRVERAQEMLAQTDLPLAEIAFAVGFFDQGHLDVISVICSVRPLESFGGRNGRKKNVLAPKPDVFRNAQSLLDVSQTCGASE